MCSRWHRKCQAALDHHSALQAAILTAPRQYSDQGSCAAFYSVSHHGSLYWQQLVSPAAHDAVASNGFLQLALCDDKLSCAASALDADVADQNDMHALSELQLHAVLLVLFLTMEHKKSATYKPLQALSQQCHLQRKFCPLLLLVAVPSKLPNTRRHQLHTQLLQSCRV